MALSPDEQELYDFAKAALPAWYADSDRANEFLKAAAKMMGASREKLRDWLREQALILQAAGGTATEPDWLAQHAADRGTSRQATETNAALAERIRNVPEALTRESILEAAQAIVDAEGVVGTVAMEELPADGAYVRTYVSDTGTGGTFAGPASGVMTFTPTVKFARPPIRVAWAPFSYELVVAGAANAGNNGTFAVTGVSADGALYANGAGVAGADAGVTWTARKLDPSGNLIDGFNRAYAGRGYRATHARAKIVIILPFGSTASTEAAVREMLRQKKAAGVAAVVERRLVP